MMAPQPTSSGRSIHLDTRNPDLARNPHLDIPAPPQRLQIATQSRSPATLRLESDGGDNATGSTSPSYLVVSGGTGCNAICAAFAAGACYVLPVSDDGGSSSEIIRVLGGPSIGNVLSFTPSRFHPLSLAYHQLTLVVVGFMISRYYWHHI